MTMIRKLPLTMAVIAAFSPFTSVIAQEFTQEQIDAIVAKAVDKALADRQAKIDAAADKKVDVITNPQTTAASPDMAIPFGLKFSGYARYGAHFQTGDQKYVGVDGSYNGASAIGRLGNESNGGEFQISKAFKSAQGAIWDLNVMFDHWSDEVNLKKAYVGVTNVLESNPNAYIWAGRDFHPVSYTHLDVYKRQDLCQLNDSLSLDLRICWLIYCPGFFKHNVFLLYTSRCCLRPGSERMCLREYQTGLRQSGSFWRPERYFINVSINTSF
ncbi:carbohydrate porin [Klebsiella aerogenes]|uniref:carbohydrate porin n=1 Tax=Klebsiella aerogenes TaxID=548 RepID=UPI00226B9AD8|nr:carbohydrate porin [Klebsiella aerogenes]